MSFQTHFLQEDYFVLCAYRFMKWFECDMNHYGQKIEYAKRKEEYPCNAYFYEAQFACADDLFECMLELAYYRKFNGITRDKYLNLDLYSHPTIWDAPDPNKNIKLTY